MSSMRSASSSTRNSTWLSLKPLLYPRRIPQHLFGEFSPFSRMGGSGAGCVTRFSTGGEIRIRLNVSSSRLAIITSKGIRQWTPHLHA
jgi:hypothetical protein